MRKSIFIYLLFIYLISCKRKQNYYHGIIVDNDLKPVFNVLVKEEFNDSVFIYSQKNGYFKLQKRPNIISNLIFLKEGYLSDTVETVKAYYGENIRYLFLNEKTDTIQFKKTP